MFHPAGKFRGQVIISLGGFMDKIKAFTGRLAGIACPDRVA